MLQTCCDFLAHPFFFFPHPKKKIIIQILTCKTVSMIGFNLPYCGLNRMMVCDQKWCLLWGCDDFIFVMIVDLFFYLLIIYLCILKWEYAFVLTESLLKYAKLEQDTQTSYQHKLVRYMNRIIEFIAVNNSIRCSVFISIYQLIASIYSLKLM